MDCYDRSYFMSSYRLHAMWSVKKKNCNDVRFIFIYTCSQLFLTVKAFYVNLILYCQVYQKKSTDIILLIAYLNNPATVCKVCFGFCFMFLFSCLLFWSFVTVLSCLHAIGSLVHGVMFWLVVLSHVSCPHWLVLVMWCSLFAISSHVVAFVPCGVLML